MATDESKKLTAEEFYEWASRPENHDKNHELDRGSVVEVRFGSVLHGFVCANVACVLSNHVYGNRCGHVCSNNSGVILERNPDTVFGPDVGFYSGKESLDEMSDWFATIPPKLAIEVLSSDDEVTRMSRRVSRFLKAGVGLVWLVDPAERAVSVYTLDRSPYFQHSQELTGEDVLPDFRCRVAELFALPGQ